MTDVELAVFLLLIFSDYFLCLSLSLFICCVFFSSFCLSLYVCISFYFNFIFAIVMARLLQKLNETKLK